MASKKSNNTQTLASAAKVLIQTSLKSSHSMYGFSTASCQGYDTAWVAMISKGQAGHRVWLFPESFDYILKTQSRDGSWGIHPASQTSGIVDTAASLLVLLKHRREPLQINTTSIHELDRRIISATRSLRDQLNQWDDIKRANHIGMEMTIPSLLRYLEEEDESLTFTFPCQKVLEKMHTAKLSSFRMESLYEQKSSSVIHSLEAFIGKLDFDRLSHHLLNGSMMASPSSTAAYLIHASNWNDQAEAYLRHVITTGAGCGDGGIPGTFPTTYFEYSWILATLLQSGFSRTSLECPELESIVNILEKALEEGEGIIGFGPGAPDADDTAKALLALKLLGRDVSPDQMIRTYEGICHFTTYGSERDPSVTTNCHVLLALLHQSDVSIYYKQIIKLVKFLCKYCWTGHGKLKDKWHLSYLYPTMILMETFTELIKLFDVSAFSELAGQKLKKRTHLALFQACFRTLLDQGEDGSWGGLPEQTSYAILTLRRSRNVWLFKDIQGELETAIDRGIDFLENRDLQNSDYSWTSKTAYRVGFVAEAYELAALHSRHYTHYEDGPIAYPSNARTDTFVPLLRQTQLFSATPVWQLRAAIMESGLFASLLEDQETNVYAQHAFQVARGQYLDLILLGWISCNNTGHYFLSNQWVYNMMLLSVYCVQTNEYIEMIAAPEHSSNLPGLHKLIDEIITTTALQNADQTFEASEDYGTDEKYYADPVGTFPSPIGAISICLARFIRYVQCHELVLKSSSWDRENLCRKLGAYLHARIAQSEEKSR